MEMASMWIYFMPGDKKFEGSISNWYHCQTNKATALCKMSNKRLLGATKHLYNFDQKIRRIWSFPQKRANDCKIEVQWSHIRIQLGKARLLKTFENNSNHGWSGRSNT